MLPDSCLRDGSATPSLANAAVSSSSSTRDMATLLRMKNRPTCCCTTLTVVVEGARKRSMRCCEEAEPVPEAAPDEPDPPAADAPSPAV
eukprot:358160-Chlamydomonas_euryale.AAC.1